MDDFCEDHSSKFMGKVHPDRNMKHEVAPDHQRGVGHPAKHSKGQMPSQLNPDHGSHRHGR